jgi:PAS domain S-box-containing protein
MSTMRDQAVFEAISYASPLGVFQADAAGALVQASGRWQTLLGTDARSALGSGWLASVHPEDREQVQRSWQAAVAAGVPFDMEFRVLPAQDGDEPAHVRMEARPAVWGQPPRPGFVGVAGDITRHKQVEQQLRLDHRFLERAERLSGVGGWEADLVSRSVKWTDQNCRIYDLEPGHQAGFSEHLRFFGEQAQRALLGAVRRSLRSGKAWQLELPMVTATGRQVWVRSVGVPEFEGGRAVRLVGTLQDITEQQLAREALRESEERQKRAMNASRLALWDLDLESGLAYLSENWAELMGSPRQVTVTPVSELVRRVPLHDQERIQAALSAMLDGSTEQYDVEHQVQRDDGSTMWLHSQGRVSRRDAAGRALRASGTNQDITSRKLAELELARAAAINRATLDSTADGILVLGGDRETLLYNRRLLEFLRIPDDLRGAPREVWSQLVADQMTEPEAYAQRIQTLYGDAATESFDVLQFKDGRVIELYGRGVALEGGVTGRVWSCRDVTARHRFEAELKRAKEAAEAANRAKTDFLDTVNHEIRTPLNGVLGMTQLLLEDALQPQQRRYVELAHSSAQSLLGLINDLLDLGKIESGRMEFEHVEFNVADLARELGDLYGLRARDKGLGFELRLDPAVPAAVVGDPGRLRHVLNNLLGNALKFTEAGRVGLAIEPAAATGNRPMLAFTVHDTGIGIPPEVQQDLFHRFFQADSSTTREYGGTGLGLAIVKQLCEQMGGSIDLQSEPGRGAAFRCVLPFGPAAQPAGQGQRAVAAETSARRARELRSERILVAEDNATNQIVVRGMLKLAGYMDVTLAEHGQQVLDAVARERFDLILMDCRMPVMDGYEASSRLRAGGHRLPIIAVTANVSGEQRQKCLAAGMDDFLSKPMDAAQLTRMLDRWLAPLAEAVFARQKALDRLDGDTELFGQVLDSFVVLAPQLIDQAARALDGGDATTAHRHLHSLAGSAAMIGAELLAGLAREFEQQARESKLRDTAQMAAGLQSAFRDFLLASKATTEDRSP